LTSTGSIQPRCKYNEKTNHTQIPGPPGPPLSIICEWTGAT